MQKLQKSSPRALVVEMFPFHVRLNPCDRRVTVDEQPSSHRRARIPACFRLHNYNNAAQTPVARVEEVTRAHTWMSRQPASSLWSCKQWGYVYKSFWKESTWVHRKCITVEVRLVKLHADVQRHKFSITVKNSPITLMQFPQMEFLKFCVCSKITSSKTSEWAFFQISPTSN